MMRSLVVCNPSQTLLRDEVKVDGMGSACGTHYGEEKCIKNFGYKKNVKERGHLKKLRTDRRIILKRMLKK